MAEGWDAHETTWGFPERGCHRVETKTDTRSQIDNKIQSLHNVSPTVSIKQSEIPTHARKQENVTHSKNDNRDLIETDLQMVQIVDLAEALRKLL